VSTRALDLQQLQETFGGQLVSAQRLEERRGHRASGIAALDALLGGGWPRAALAELQGRRSSGRTAIVLASLARAVAAGETAALVDAGGALDPRRAAGAGLALPHLLWIRCPQALALKAADMVVGAGGFDLVALDLGEDRPRAPTASWIRLKHGAERQGTTILVATPAPAAGAFAAATVELSAAAPSFSTPALLEEIRARATCQRGRNRAFEEEAARCAWLAFSYRS
jgi:hypothetical protein